MVFALELDLFCTEHDSQSGQNCSNGKKYQDPSGVTVHFLAEMQVGGIIVDRARVLLLQITGLSE
jgi:hypothetical protein